MNAIDRRKYREKGSQSTNNNYLVVEKKLAWYKDFNGKWLEINIALVI